LLIFIAPGASKPLDVVVFSRDGCECRASSKGMLRDAGIVFEELLLNRDYSEATTRVVSGRSTVPQVFIYGYYISV
jgi:glutaredoxin